MITKEIILFFIYCIIGWICEVIYCAFLERKFLNRGFLSGPYLPIYGFGAVAVLKLIEPFVSNIFLLFFLSLVVTSIIEYVGSYSLETVFNVKLWDYSKHKVNINGRVSLFNSLMFGLLSVFVVYVINPFVNEMVLTLSRTFQNYFATIIVIVMSFDFVHSVIKMRAFNKALEEIKQKSEEFKIRLSANIESGKTELTQAIKDKWNKEVSQSKAKLAKQYKRIILTYPSMKSKSKFIDNHLIKLREDFESWLLEGKKQYEEFKLKAKNLKNK